MRAAFSPGGTFSFISSEIPSLFTNLFRRAESAVKSIVLLAPGRRLLRDCQFLLLPLAGPRCLFTPTHVQCESLGEAETGNAEPGCAGVSFP